MEILSGYNNILSATQQELLLDPQRLGHLHMNHLQTLNRPHSLEVAVDSVTKPTPYLHPLNQGVTSCDPPMCLAFQAAKAHRHPPSAKSLKPVHSSLTTFHTNFPLHGSSAQGPSLHSPVKVTVSVDLHPVAPPALPPLLLISSPPSKLPVVSLASLDTFTNETVTSLPTLQMGEPNHCPIFPWSKQLIHAEKTALEEQTTICEIGIMGARHQIVGGPIIFLHKLFPILRMGEPEYRPMSQLGESSIVLQQALSPVDPLADGASIPSVNPVIVGKNAPTISNDNQVFLLVPTTSIKHHQNPIFEVGELQFKVPFQLRVVVLLIVFSILVWIHFHHSGRHHHHTHKPPCLRHTAIYQFCFVLGRVSYSAARVRSQCGQA